MYTGGLVNSDYKDDDGDHEEDDDGDDPGPLNCFCASQHQILAKSASQKARNRDNALFTTNMHKSSINCVNVNHEQ